MTEEPSLPADKPPDPSPTASSDSGLSWSLALFLLTSLVFVVFIVQNSDAVLVKFLNWEGNFSLSLVLVITALLAVIADEVFGVMRRRRHRRRMSEREELKRFRSS
jgi:lipopolysaccharide assembly protein A